MDALMLSRRRVMLSLGVALIAALGFSALAAGAAQANWYVNKKANEAGVTHEFGSVSDKPHTLTMNVPHLNISVKCAYVVSSGAISGLTYLRFQQTLNKYGECAAYQLGNFEKPLTACEISNTSTIKMEYEGTGAGVVARPGEGSGTITFVHAPGKLCVLYGPHTISIPELSLTYGKEDTRLNVLGSGNGTWNGKPMSVTTSYYWGIFVGYVWHWH